MKCHSILCLLVIIGGQSWVQASPEAETLSVDELTAEHRSAKPEPFLDKIAAFFAGNTRKQDKPTYQHGAASVPRPQYVRPPVPPKPPVRPPNLLKRPPSKPQPVYGHDQSSAASSNFNSFASPGAGGGGFSPPGAGGFASPGAGGGGGKNFQKCLSNLFKLVQTCLNLSKLVQTCSNLFKLV